jgi:phage baseplate assembly protein gpV
MTTLQQDVRRLAKANEGVDQRRAKMLLTGTVAAVQGAKVKVRLGEDDDGESIITPWLSMAGRTGKRGQGVSEFTRLGIGEPVLVVSPSGEPGSGSAVMPWSDSQDDPSPGNAETDGKVIEVGEARVSIKADEIRLSVGDRSVTIRQDRIVARLGEGAGAARVTLRPGYAKLKFGDHYLFLDATGIGCSVVPAPKPEPEPSM